MLTRGSLASSSELSAEVARLNQKRGYATIVLKVPRRSERLGISLNDQNRITKLGEAALSGLCIYDWVVAYDGVELGSQKLADVIGALPQLPAHELVVLRPQGKSGALPAHAVPHSLARAHA